MSRAMTAYALLRKGDADGALTMAREAVAVDPNELLSQTALGDIAAAKGNKDEARSVGDRARNCAATGAGCAAELRAGS